MPKKVIFSARKDHDVIRKVEEILKKHVPYVLSMEVEKEIELYVHKVEKRNINEYLNKI